MAFNFGEKPFKYNLPAGYNAINTATNEMVVINNNGEVASAAVTKSVSNAPQAVIIEVTICLRIKTMFYIIYVLFYYFLSHPGNWQNKRMNK